jgi:hypothetical protein
MAKRRPAEVLASRTILAMPSGAWSRPRQSSDFPRLVSASEQNIALEGRNIVPGARFSLFGKHLKFLAGVMQCCGAKG